MAGKPGRSGGPRANSGGAREGAGRPPKEPDVAVETDPLEFLISVMQGKTDPSPAQLKAAIAAAQYVHTKKGAGGKKDAAKTAAETAAGGRFTPGAPPKLVHSR